MINAPRIHDIPANDSALAYNEDELVTVLTNIYKHFIEVAYLPEKGVLFPPQDTGRHTLDMNYLRDELHLDARVISLLERLPYVSRKDFPECEWYPSAHVVNYLDHEDALRARDPAMLSATGGGDEQHVPNVEFMRPGDVALSLPANPSDYMFTLILDTAASQWPLRMNIVLMNAKRNADSIRRLHSYCELPSSVDRAKLEVPEHENHYRNQPAYHAPTFFYDYYSRLRSLEYIPFAMGIYYIHGPCVRSFLVLTWLRCSLS